MACDAVKAITDANGDGFVSFDEFEALMNSKAVAKPNALNRWVAGRACGHDAKAGTCACGGAAL